MVLQSETTLVMVETTLKSVDMMEGTAVQGQTRNAGIVMPIFVFVMKPEKAFVQVVIQQSTKAPKESLLNDNLPICQELASTAAMATAMGRIITKPATTMMAIAVWNGQTVIIAKKTAVSVMKLIQRTAWTLNNVRKAGLEITNVMPATTLRNAPMMEVIAARMKPIALIVKEAHACVMKQDFHIASALVIMGQNFRQ